MAQQARQVLAACEKSPSDAVKLDYDPRNPFDVCSVTFTPIYRGACCASAVTHASSAAICLCTSPAVFDGHGPIAS